MATRTSTERTYFNPYTTLGLGAVAGVLAGVVFGFMIQFVMGRMVAIGALYTLGEPSLTIGWIAHIIHSALFGMVYAILSLTSRLDTYLRTLPLAIGVGAAYGLALWFLNIGFVWPAWLNYVSFGPGLPIPYFPMQPLVGHLVYGAGTGAFFAFASE